MSSLSQLLIGIKQSSGTDWNTLPYGTAIEGGFYAGKVNQSDGLYAIIVAPKSAETSLAYKTTNTSTSGTSSYNDGLANSNNMNNAQHPAAQYCRAYNGAGFTDWYLPARDELEVCYRNLKPSTVDNATGVRSESGNHGDNANSVPVGTSYTTSNPPQTTATAFKEGGSEAFSLTGYYRSSTESASTVGYSWAQRLNFDGRQTILLNNSSNPVRPVRRIKI